MNDGPTSTARPWWRSRWLTGGGSLAVVVLIFGFFFPKVADYGEVWRTLEAMTFVEIATLTALAAWNIASYWPMLTAVQPGLRLRAAAVSNLASTAVSNTMPGGGAIGMGVTVTMQRSWGLAVASTTLGMVVSGVWNNFVKLGLPVVALGLLAMNGEVGAGLATAAVAGIVVLVTAIGLFALLLRSARMAASVGRGVGRVVSSGRRLRVVPPWRAGTIAPLRSGPTLGVDLLTTRWMRITITAFASHLSLFAVLLLALRNVGVSDDEVSWQLVLAAFAFVRLMSAIPITPGGLGVVELGLTAMLASGVPDAAKNQVAAAVLLYRALTWLLPIPLGVVCWIFWRVNRSWRSDRLVVEASYGHPAAVGWPG